MRIEGKITNLGKVETVGEKNIAKINLVVEEKGEKYPNSLSVDFWDSKVEYVKNYKVGDVVIIEFNTKAREYKDRFFNSINGRKIEKVDILEDESEDLPF